MKCVRCGCEMLKGTLMKPNTNEYVYQAFLECTKCGFKISAVHEDAAEAQAILVREWNNLKPEK